MAILGETITTSADSPTEGWLWEKTAHRLIIVLPVKEVGSRNHNLISAISVDVRYEWGA